MSWVSVEASPMRYSLRIRSWRGPSATTLRLSSSVCGVSFRPWSASMSQLSHDWGTSSPSRSAFSAPPGFTISRPVALSTSETMRPASSKRTFACGVSTAPSPTTNADPPPHWASPSGTATAPSAGTPSPETASRAFPSTSVTGWQTTPSPSRASPSGTPSSTSSPVRSQLSVLTTSSFFGRRGIGPASVVSACSEIASARAMQPSSDSTASSFTR